MWVAFQGPNFTLKTPSNWFINATPDIQAMFVEPQPGEGKLRANLLISLQVVQPGVTTEAVMRTARETQIAEYPEFKVEDEGIITGKAVDGRFQFYTWLNPESRLRVLQSQSFYIANRVLFTLTSTCDLSRQGEIMPILSEMLAAFTIEINN
jgi:hypothetical protein